jgi:Mor family transcriptional regulator
VIDEMTIRMEKLKTLHSEGKIDWSVKDVEEPFSLSLNFKSDIDGKDPQTPKSEVNFGLLMEAEEKEFSIGGETKTIGKTSYYRLTKLTFPKEEIPLEAEPMLNLVIKLIKDKWLKIDPESILNALRKIAEMTGEELPPEIEEQFKKFSQIQEKIQKKIEELLRGKKFFLPKKELPDEKIGEKKLYHYLVSLNKEELKKTIVELLKAMSEIIGKPIEEEEIKEFQEEFDKFFEKIGGIEAEIWIGKKDLYLYKIKAKKEIDLSKIEPEEKGRIIIKVEVDFSNFDQPIEIKAPEEFISIEEIIEAIFAPFLSSLKEARSKARDARRMSDISMIRSAMEMYYLDHGKYLTSKTMPERIEHYLLVEMPKDPGSGPCPEYRWISNLKNPQKFCVFACLENGNFYAVSHKGTKELEEPPKTLDCW